ncbi:MULTISPECIES: class I SAM-dependent methyltransferase [unclassified Paenibacillus]|uniref:class I SAM-dependent methyltransferase n=1 Tax=unclassified Paenibacillus TaxID=185978 RepID=UPI000402A74F|nr:MULTISPECIES: class I SAM-dependent methyltransferase [unclassified Paenibacillus]KGP84336.1 SAM-dependent methyltransferase [Paenibacillus sp. MAEPY2]KGP87373.1 SAM-dependent methyltransferase [Paenibacillus sp. MAEPY1]
MSNDQIKGQVRKQFAKNADKYVTSVGHAKGDDLSLLVASSQANSDMKVLDIATGGGHVANALAPLVEQVTALDLTEEMLQVAERFIRGNGHQNVDFVAGDAEHIPFEDDLFDLVTCRIAAHHFPDVSSFVSEALRVLKPGGKLLLIDNVAPERDENDQFYNEIEKWRDASHVRAWRKTEWVRMLELAGFRMATMVTFEKRFIFEDWCNRAGLPEAESRELEASMLSAPSVIKKYFKFEETQQGRLFSFEGESVYIQAIKAK